MWTWNWFADKTWSPWCPLPLKYKYKSKSFQSESESKSSKKSTRVHTRVQLWTRSTVRLTALDAVTHFIHRQQLQLQLPKMTTPPTTTTPAENTTMLSRLRTIASKTPAASMHTSSLLDSCVSVGRPGANTPNTYFHTESKSNYNQWHQQSTSPLLTLTCNFIATMLDVIHPWYVG